MKNIFAHTIGRADLIGGVVRCELNTLLPGEEGEEQPRSVVTHAVVMPVDGFLRAFATLEELVRKLVEAEVIAPQQREEAESAVDKAAKAQRAEESGGEMRPPTSPNFI